MLIKKIFKNKKITIASFVVVLLFTGFVLPYDIVFNKFTMLKLERLVKEANAGMPCPSSMGGTFSMVQECNVQNQAGTCNCCTDVVGNYVCGSYRYATYTPAGAGSGTLCVMKGVTGIGGTQIQAGAQIIGCHKGQPNVFTVADSGMSFATNR